MKIAAIFLTGLSAVSALNLGADLDLGIGKLLDADADADLSLSKSDGIDADVDVDLGLDKHHKDVADADVDVDLGVDKHDGVDADVDVDLGLKKAGGGGDPHFRTFDGTQYSFHGECDLVMARSVEKDIDVHIRTHSMGSWSLISNAALRVGSDILEFENDGSHYINGSPVDLPYALSGLYRVTKDIDIFEGKDDVFERQSLLIDLGNGEHIRMTNFKGMIFVRFSAYFKDTEGMLGVHGISGLVGRDGSVLGDADAMGAEWQVRNSEPMLFREVRFPQYPQTCVPPTASGRRLRVSASEKETAEKACAGVDDFSMHFCIEDVLLTGDVSRAEGYLFGEAF